MEYDRFAINIFNGVSQRWKVIAFLERKGKLLCYAINNPSKTHPTISKYNPRKRLHAEIRLLNKAQKESLDGCKMLVYRLKKIGFGMARPCPICFSEILNTGIKEIIYSTENGVIRERI